MGNSKVRWVPLVFDRDIDAYNEVMAHFTQTILAAHRQWKGNENVAVCQSVPDDGVPSEEVIETIREALKLRREHIPMDYYMDDGHKIWYRDEDEMKAVDAAEAWLSTVIQEGKGNERTR